MNEDVMADLAWELFEIYGPGTVAYCEDQAEQARLKGEAGMVAYWGSMARLAAENSDPEN